MQGRRERPFEFWRCVIGVLMSLAAAPVSLAAPDPADRASPEADRLLEQWLEDHGLDDLLSEHLAARLAGAPPESREEMVVRLAEIYARLLESDLSPQRAADIERRARQLTESTPPADAFDLRLTLGRANYNRAERLAEQWRLRLVQPAERDAAVAAFNDLARDLDDIADRAGRMVDELEHQEEVGREADAELIAQHLTASRRRRSLANHLSGWSKAYAAELTDDPRLAEGGLRNFGVLLNAPPGQPADLARASTQGLRFEHVVRAAIGAAVCESVRGNVDAALAWLDLVQAEEGLSPAIGTELAVRRMAVFARGGRWRDLAALVQSRRMMSALGAGEARLLAVVAGEAKAGAPEDIAAVRAILEGAVADLVAAGELSHALDLSTRYTIAPTASTGFVADCVRGLRAYDAARTLHRASGEALDQPAGRAEIARRYRDASDALRRALSAQDASSFRGANPSAELLAGMSLYFAARFDAGTASPPFPARLLEAANWLVRAADHFSDHPRAVESLLGAVRALDLAVGEAGESPAKATVASRRDEVIDSFLRRFPDDAAAGALIMRRAMSGSLPPDQAATMLLRVPPESSAHEAARRHASRLLYEIYRSAPDQRDWHALRYAAVEEPLLAADVRRALEGDSEAASRASAAARRLLDAILAVAVPDGARAKSVLDAIDTLAARGKCDPSAFHEELVYRRAQVALARGDVPAAERAVDALLHGDGATRGAAPGPFADAARRLLLHHAIAEWRDARRSGADPARIAAAARDVMARGADILLNPPRVEETPGGAESSALLSAVATAAADVSDAGGPPEARADAIRLHRAALAVEPANAVLLRRMAELCETAGDDASALDCWRTLASGLEPASDAWFEARWRLISVLARIDSARAREAISQHRALHPEYGPPPWGDRLRTLDAQLAGSGGSTPP